MNLEINSISKDAIYYCIHTNIQRFMVTKTCENFAFSSLCSTDIAYVKAPQSRHSPQNIKFKMKYVHVSLLV